MLFCFVKIFNVNVRHCPQSDNKHHVPTFLPVSVSAAFCKVKIAIQSTTTRCRKITTNINQTIMYFKLGCLNNKRQIVLDSAIENQPNPIVPTPL